ncbi:hypothetical protein WR25_21038 [Diploscapter pachys]|uniref:Tuberin N-terminal domain-containing protein n=1 Tax=Diploscapter pachys TaxID=2018661 RepID=A0A2A2LUU8_9BILA|nr:hypothetical protein WR25_21038 [Diploscapter pachys]
MSNPASSPEDSSSAGIRHQSSVAGSLSAVANSPSPASSPANNIWSRLFAGSNKDKHNDRALISNEGSISDHAWKGMNANTPKRVRLEMLSNLQESPVYRTFHGQTQRLRANSSLFNLFRNGPKREEQSDTERIRAVMHNRTLQVSTLEGIWHEIKDALEIADMREPAVRLMIDMTEQQYKQLGLALRHTFFEEINKLDCGELTLRWLVALSENGKNPNGFEREMDILLADWVVCVLKDDDEHPQALHVLQLVQSYIKSNAAFISEENTVKILEQVCRRGSQGKSEALTKECLNIVDSVLKFSDMPRSSLFEVVSMVVILVCDVTNYKEQSWKLAKSLLTSQLGHRTFKVMLRILEIDGGIEGVDQKAFERMLRGCVFCLANANWGTSQIDTVRVITPALIIPHMQKAVAVSESICRGRLQKSPEFTKNKFKHNQDCEPELHELLRLVEQLYKDNQLNANPDHLFNLIEKCSMHMKDVSVLKLIEYRASNINPQVVDWIGQMKALIEKYSTAHSYERRSKAIDELQLFYNKYRICYEGELVYQLMLPILAETHQEDNNQNQVRKK